jgi:hypothetical protein
MSLPEDYEALHEQVRRIFRIDDITTDDAAQGYLVRYRGQLTGDSIAAYDQLAEAARPYGLTPLFRPGAAGGHVILLVLSPNLPKGRTSINVNIMMFILTVFSVMISGIQPPEGAVMPEDFLGQMVFVLQNIFSGWPFALALLSILLAHEFGHYLAGRFHKTDVTLPFFIPLPFSLLGTMGAFINMREIPKNKRILLDIGIAGPLAGLFVAIPVLLFGLQLSELGPVLPADGGGFIEGNSLLYLAAKYLVFGQFLPAPADYGGLEPLIYWISYFFTGSPLPYGGVDVFIHPVALAGWAGLMVTALNLIPAGQLDGGHILYALFGNRIRYALPVILVVLGVLGIFWGGWWLWVAILWMFGRSSAEPRDQITELDPRRRALAILTIFIFLLVFSPVPFVTL